MEKRTIRVEAKVNGYIYKSEVDRNVRCEKGELIASCKRHIRVMLDTDRL